MQWLPTCLLLVVAAHGGGGVTKTSSIEQFWTDDFKIFEQVYGKTSDKDIYGDSLPAPITFNRDKKTEASEKKERYIINYNDPDAELLDSYHLDDSYNNLLSKHPLKIYSKIPSSSINFISYSNFKPISQTNDPEAYSYLKHLEDYSKGEKYDFPKSEGVFKPYLDKEVVDPQESDAYKSIQEILDAHEANKGSYRLEEDVKYLSYPKSKKPPRMFNDVKKRRCVEPRCRKRVSNFRVRNRPHRRTPSFKTVVVM